MTSSNGNIFRVTGRLLRGIHRSPVNSPHKGQWRGALMFSLICVWIDGWVNNREAGDLRRYRAHCDVTVMNALELLQSCTKPSVWCYPHEPPELVKQAKAVFSSWDGQLTISRQVVKLGTPRSSSVQPLATTQLRRALWGINTEAA